MNPKTSSSRSTLLCLWSLRPRFLPVGQGNERGRRPAVRVWSANTGKKGNAPQGLTLLQMPRWEPAPRLQLGPGSPQSSSSVCVTPLCPGPSGSHGVPPDWSQTAAGPSQHKSRRGALPFWKSHPHRPLSSASQHHGPRPSPPAPSRPTQAHTCLCRQPGVGSWGLSAYVCMHAGAPSAGEDTFRAAFPRGDGLSSPSPRA